MGGIEPGGGIGKGGVFGDGDGTAGPRVAAGGGTKGSRFAATVVLITQEYASVNVSKDANVDFSVLTQRHHAVW